jgi:hypothetical protein
MDCSRSGTTVPGRIVRVANRDIYVVEAGAGPPVLMLHGGGPGASGMPNFVRNIPALAAHFRLIIPDLPGYGRSSKGLDRKDPFGDLAGANVRPMRRARHRQGACAGQLPRRRLRAAHGARAADAHRSPRAARAWRRRHHAPPPDCRSQAFAGLLRRRGAHAGQARRLPARRSRVRCLIPARQAHRGALPGKYRRRDRGQSAAGSSQGLAEISRHRLHPRSAPRQPRNPNPAALGDRGPGQSRERRSFAAAADAELRPLSVQSYRPLGAVGTGRGIQRGDVCFLSQAGDARR